MHPPEKIVTAVIFKKVNDKYQGGRLLDDSDLRRLMRAASFVAFCFSKPEDAEAFCQRFGGDRQSGV